MRDGQEQDPGAAFTLKANAPTQQYIEVPVQTPAGYSPGDASVADLIAAAAGTTLEEAYMTLTRGAAEFRAEEAS